MIEHIFELLGMLFTVMHPSSFPTSWGTCSSHRERTNKQTNKLTTRQVYMGVCGLWWPAMHMENINTPHHSTAYVWLGCSVIKQQEHCSVHWVFKNVHVVAYIIIVQKQMYIVTLCISWYYSITFHTPLNQSVKMFVILCSNWHLRKRTTILGK